MFQVESGEIGYRNAEKVVIIPPIFNPIDTIYRFWGLDDTLPFYTLNSNFNDHGYAKVIDDTGIVIIDTLGNKMYRPFIIDNSIDLYSNGLTRIKKDGKIGFIDEYGVIVVPPIYEYAGIMSCNRAVASLNATRFNDGEYSFVKDGYWGYISPAGNWALPPIYSSAGTFYNGFAGVVLADGKAETIDTSGTVMKGLHKGAIYDVLDSSNDSLLMEYLNKYGYQPDFRYPIDDNPEIPCAPILWYAVYTNKPISIIKKLLQAGASFDEKNCFGISVKELAVYNENYKVLNLLKFDNH